MSTNYELGSQCWFFVRVGSRGWMNVDFLNALKASSVTKKIKNEASIFKRTVESYVYRWKLILVRKRSVWSEFMTSKLQRQKKIITLTFRDLALLSDWTEYSPNYQLWKGMDFLMGFFDFSCNIQLYLAIKKSINCQQVSNPFSPFVFLP